MKSIFVIDNKLEAITNGMFHVSMKEKMDVLEARKTELNSKLTAVTEAQPVFYTLPSQRSMARRSWPMPAVSMMSKKQTGSIRYRTLVYSLRDSVNPSHS